MLEILVAGLLVLQDEAAPLGLQINWSKTKIQHVGEPRMTQPSVLVAAENVDFVDEFIYLGSLISHDGGSEAREYFCLLEKSIWRSHIYTTTKVHLYRTYILPVLLYTGATGRSTLSQLKSQGMNVQALHTLFTGLIMSKITYALPAFAGQLTADDRNHIGAISRKAQRRGVSHTAFDIDELMDSVDRKLFTHITTPSHCLHHLLPSKTSAHCSYSLRKRQHCYQLPHIEYSQYRNSFINRCLFNFR